MPKVTSATSMIGKPVVVTTSHRGVFFGTLESRDDSEATITDASLCVYWSANVRGFLGLAVDGPLSGCKISKAAPRLTLTGVTSITECTPEAAAKWRSTPWA